MKTLLPLLAGLLSFTLFACRDIEAKGDVSFAKSTFESLTRGDSDVIEKIDWETLISLGIPVGQQYLALKDDSEREEFRKGFVTQFSTNFRESGGSVENFTNWRVTLHDENNTRVAADSPDGVLKLTVSERNGTEKLSAFEIVK